MSTSIPHKPKPKPRRRAHSRKPRPGSCAPQGDGKDHTGIGIPKEDQGVGGGSLDIGDKTQTGGQG
jgi:hypothetical protein